MIVRHISDMTRIILNDLKLQIYLYIPWKQLFIDQLPCANQGHRRLPFGLQGASWKEALCFEM